MNASNVFIFLLATLWASTCARGDDFGPSAINLERSPPSQSHLNARQNSGATNCGINPCTVFDPVEQLVNVAPGSGHEFVHPAPSDIRGPCPGLNAAANHGFLPHNGLPTLAESIAGLGEAYGMGPDLAGILAVYGVVMSGDATSTTWSIGGPYHRPGLLGPVLDALLGVPQGISYSHNRYEGDSSVTRFDAYMNNGDAHSLNMTKFLHLYNMADSYTLDHLRAHNAWNVEQSVSSNPYYFSGPLSGVVAAAAAHNFVVTMFSNHTADNPSGYLDKPTLKSFFGISGPENALVWNKGQEQIPWNWYRRPGSQMYSFAEGVADLLISHLQYPSSLRIGGNTGTVNSFVGVDLGSLSGGTYNADTILQGDNLGCFLLQTLQIGLPSILGGLLSATGITQLLALVNNIVSPVLGTLTCPELAAYNQGLFNQFPGFNYNPTGQDQSY